MKYRWLIALLFVAVFGEFGFAYIQSHRAAFGICAVNPSDHPGLMTSSVGTRTERVFFIGNSLTFFNDLPGMLIEVANSDPQNPVKLVVGSSTRSNASLRDLYVDGCALNQIRAEHFDTIVLQEHSFFWFGRRSATEAWNGLWLWANAARQARSAPEYFEPWVDSPSGDPAFSKVAGMEIAANAYAKAFGVPLVRVGEAFAETQHQPGAPNLYRPDFHHPSPAGTYLAALIFFHHFTGEPAERTTWRPDGVSTDQAALLARVADKYS